MCFKASHLKLMTLKADLVIVRTVCRLFDAAVFTIVSNLDTNDRVNIQTCQLLNLNDLDGHLSIINSDLN